MTMRNDPAVSLTDDSPTMRLVRRLTGGLENLCALILFAMLALSFTLVVLRYVFAIGFAGAEETMRFLFVYATAIGASIAVLRGDHIRISVLVDALPPTLAGWMDRLRHLLVIACNAMVGWLSIDWINQVGHYPTSALGIPQWVVQISVTLGTVLVILISIATLVGGERRMSVRDDLQEGQL
ncbi:TRAP transporter small permease [Halomonas sp. V046]|uniref:TRAP transporter small permease n=1 Tax=Halomonas sp. V046 TaxID=3459611 RepID=UPI004043B510